jgi:hypothetical protein
MANVNTCRCVCGCLQPHRTDWALCPICIAYYPLNDEVHHAPDAPPEKRTDKSAVVQKDLLRDFLRFRKDVLYGD